MLEIIGLGVELVLTGSIFSLVIKIIERIDKLERTIQKTEKVLHREEIQSRVFESEKPVRGIN